MTSRITGKESQGCFDSIGSCGDGCSLRTCREEVKISKHAVNPPSRTIDAGYSTDISRVSKESEQWLSMK